MPKKNKQKEAYQFDDIINAYIYFLKKNKNYEVLWWDFHGDRLATYEKQHNGAILPEQNRRINAHIKNSEIMATKSEEYYTDQIIAKEKNDTNERIYIHYTWPWPKSEEAKQQKPDIKYLKGYDLQALTERVSNNKINHGKHEYIKADKMIICEPYSKLTVKGRIKHKKIMSLIKEQVELTGCLVICYKKVYLQTISMSKKIKAISIHEIVSHLQKWQNNIKNNKSAFANLLSQLSLNQTGSGVRFTNEFVVTSIVSSVDSVKMDSEMYFRSFEDVKRKMIASYQKCLHVKRCHSFQTRSSLFITDQTLYHSTNHSGSTIQNYLEKATKEKEMKILITGNSGIGKTTLLTYLLQLFANNKLPGHYKWVIHINLKLLQNLRKLDPNEAFHAFNFLVELLANRFIKYELSNYEKEVLQKILENDMKDGKILFLFDDIDVILKKVPNDWKAKIVYLFKHSPHVIATCRPHGLLELNNFRYRFSILTLAKFNLQQLKQYVTNFFNNLFPPQPSLVKAILATIQNQNLDDFCRIPFNLEMICASYWNAIRNSNNFETKSEFLESILKAFYFDYISSLNIKTNIYRCDATFLAKRPMAFAEFFAFQTLVNDNIILDNYKTIKYICKIEEKKLEAMFAKMLDEQNKLGLVVIHDVNQPTLCKRTFIHIVYRDILAARYLATCLQIESKDHDSKRVSYFDHKWDHATLSLKEFILQIKNKQAYQPILGYIAGFLAKRDANKALIHYFKILFAVNDIKNYQLPTTTEDLSQFAELALNIFEQTEKVILELKDKHEFIQKIWLAVQQYCFARDEQNINTCRI